MMRRTLRSLLGLLLLCSVLLTAVGCGEATPMRFSTLKEQDTLASLDGCRVTLQAYLVTNSRTDGELVYVTHRPYERISTSSDKTSVLPVYLKKAASVSMTTAAVLVTGRLELAEANTPFLTEEAYPFTVRITGAVIEPLAADALPSSCALWQRVAATGLMNNVMDAFNYVHFTCAWNTYSGKNADGTQFYLEPTHATSFIKDAGKQYYYGYSDGYFDRLTATAESLDDGRMEEIVRILAALQTLSERGLASLDGGNYTQSGVDAKDMLEGFVGYKYTVNDAEELIEEYEVLYEDFTAWLAAFELP